jgi:hypothetical protein
LFRYFLRVPNQSEGLKGVGCLRGGEADQRDVQGIIVIFIVRGEGTVKIYCRLGKKRYLGGKYTYRYERLYVPIPKNSTKRLSPF